MPGEEYLCSLNDHKHSNLSTLQTTQVGQDLYLYSHEDDEDNAEDFEDVEYDGVAMCEEDCLDDDERRDDEVRLPCGTLHYC